MRYTLGLAILSGIFAWTALAQADLDAAKLKLQKMAAESQVIKIESGVMGPAVKGAPYSADEIRENNQTLADGTHIHNEEKTTVYRDSEGRIRRENDNQITIWDPVAGAQYILNPKTMTARKMPMNVMMTKPGASPDVIALKLQAETMQEAQAQMQKALVDIAKAKDQERLTGQVPLPAGRAGVKKESLGTQMMEGVNAEGNRVTSTIEQGTIGNDRPIQMITERWYSPELQTNIMTLRSDPRSGENTIKLTNIRRGEPSPVLFEIPPGYTVR